MPCASLLRSSRGCEPPLLERGRAMATVILQAWRLNGCLHALDLQCVFRCLSSQPEKRLRQNVKCWQVSSEGRCCNTRGNISYGTLLDSGYRSVRIGERKFFVHRLVKLSFHGSPPNELAWQVRHRDGNPSNNRLDNLEYVTNRENVQRSFQNPMRGSAGPKVSKPVKWRAVGSHSWTVCPSGKLAAEQLGIDFRAVSRCCWNSSSVKGFEMCFAEQEGVEDVEEEWRPMKDPKTGVDIPDRMVSSFGLLKFRYGRVSSGYQTPVGYFRTTLSLNGLNLRTEYVHRLVAAAFLSGPPTPKHTQINHRDGDKGNNRVENLEYVTPAGNIAHHFANAGTPAHKAIAKPVESRRFASTDFWNLHASILAASKQLQINPGGISTCIHGKQKQAGGYEFRLAAPAALVIQALPGEEWRDVDLDALIRDRASRP